MSTCAVYIGIVVLAVVLALFVIQAYQLKNTPKKRDAVVKDIIDSGAETMESLIKKGLITESYLTKIARMLP